MIWRCVQLIYELRSPLYIGYHRIGNVQCTRHFVPARNLWAAVTERLTRSGFDKGVPEGDYQKIGKWVENHLAFTYFFVWEGNKPLVPEHGDGGLTYAGLPRYDFERRYLSAHVTTALDAATTSAEAGSLHEVEFIVPKYLDNDQPKTTRVGGWVFFDEEARKHLGDEINWREWLGKLWVGGERRYGFGHLCLVDWRPSEGNKLLEGYTLDLNGSRPRVFVSKDKPLLAHAPVGGFKAKGLVEPLVGRETLNSASFGVKLTPADVCWAPGAVVIGPVEVEIRKRSGLWV